MILEDTLVPSKRQKSVGRGNYKDAKDKKKGKSKSKKRKVLIKIRIKGKIGAKRIKVKEEYDKKR